MVNWANILKRLSFPMEYNFPDLFPDLFPKLNFERAFNLLILKIFYCFIPAFPGFLIDGFWGF